MKKDQNTFGHSVKEIKLPKGWEAIEFDPVGHPGDPWITIAEFCKAHQYTDVTGRKKLARLASEGRLVSCERVFKGRLTKFYRPA